MSKISQYTEVTTNTTNDVFICNQSGSTMKTTLAKIANAIFGSKTDNNLPHYTGTPTAGTTAEAIGNLETKVNAIGTIVDGTKTATVWTRTWSAKGNIVLTKGKWIIMIRVLLSQDNSGYRALNLASTSGDNTPQCITAGIYGNLTALNMTTIHEITSTSTTLYLNGYHNSTDNSELNITSWVFKAIKIA